MRNLYVCALLVVITAVARIGGDSRPPPPAGVLVRQGDLIYRGAFRLPSGLRAGGRANLGFEDGGTAIGFNPTNRSLFVVGHDWDQLVAEVGIPEIRTGALDGLRTAHMLQPLADATEGRLQAINPGDPNSKKIGGLLPFGHQLLISAYSDYDGAGTQVLSHFIRPISFATKGRVQGPFRVGTTSTGFVSGYMAIVPADWREPLGGPALAGNCCLSVIGRTSYGPAVSAFNPEDLGERNPVRASTLLSYPEAHQTLGAWNDTNAYFNGTSSVRGVVFPEGTRSVLFFGRHGLGAFCYGPGTSGEDQAGKPADGGVDRYCFDPADGSKGVHAYPYAYYVWAYDAADLASVHAGRQRPWEIRPYAVWPMTLTPRTRS